MKTTELFLKGMPFCALFLSFCAHAATSQTRSVAFIVSKDAPPEVQFGMRELQTVLNKRSDIKVTTSSIPLSAAISITLTQKTINETPRAGELSRAPDLPESFRLTIPSDSQIIVEGSDAVGTMYGALELAEQIEASHGANFIGQLHSVTQSPFLSLRGVNQFLTVQDIDSTSGAFWSDTFWQGYLDMLARDRYNLLDIHGPVEAVTLRFPNAFSYFVNLPDFPQVGVGPDKARRNMKRLQQIIQMAAARGIKVAYMNYDARPPIGAWKIRTFVKDERSLPVNPEFLENTQVEEYTRQAVTSFLKQLPQLWMFGFRIGESGQKEDFYQKTYLAALKDAPKSLNIYLRTWSADPAKLRQLAASTSHKLYIEIKYNAEQLGSPYQAVLGARDYGASGSYENYTSRPRDFSILWQIRAHGTHRVFFWGWPEFARRTVRSCKFGDGVGFSMEPMDAYNPAYDYLHNNPEVKHDFYPWMYQKEWLWHMIWGRTAFDPEVSDQVFVAEFRRRFGDEIGPLAYKATVESSKIIPFIYSYHAVGLDHQEFAPEFETGDHPGNLLFMRWAGDRVIPLGGDNQTFLDVKPLDRTAMADPATYVDLYLQQQPTGKMSPWEAAKYLDTAAQAAGAAIKEAENHSSSNLEFDCLRRDVEALTELGHYYASRIRSVTHLQFYTRTGQHDELVAAYDNLQKATSAWDRFSQIADAHYGFVPEYIRMGVGRFRWSDEGKILAVDLDEINKLEMEYRSLMQSLRPPTMFGHVPPFKARPGQPLSLRMSLPCAPAPHGVSLFYRNSREIGFRELPMQLTDSSTGTWSVTIPGDSVVTGTLEYYFEIQPRQSDFYGTVSAHAPYRVLVNDDDTKPQVIHREPVGAVEGGLVSLEIQVISSTPVHSARVFYKRMASYHEWVEADMIDVGGGRYRIQVPVTPEGILYYFEVVDRNGNATNYPDFLERTPYFVIDSWDPSQSQGRSVSSEAQEHLVTP